MTFGKMSMFRAAAFLGFVLLMFASTIAMLIPEESIRAWPTWAKIAGGAIVAIGIFLEIAWATWELKRVISSGQSSTSDESASHK